MSEKPFRVMFVCLGNICRSPVAAAVFNQLVHERGLEQHFEARSSGTGGWHVGERAHAESRRNASQNGVSLEAHRARQFERGDFAAYDLVVALDESNFEDLRALRGKQPGNLRLLREWDRQNAGDLSVPDPYYEGGFQGVFDIIHRSCDELLKELSDV